MFIIITTTTTTIIILIIIIASIFSGLLVVPFPLVASAQLGGVLMRALPVWTSTTNQIGSAPSFHQINASHYMNHHESYINSIPPIFDGGALKNTMIVDS